jgi:hydrogenase nickel incorporation protein HypA/HybF
MHEFSIAENLIEIINQQIKKDNVKRVLGIKLRIGKLTSVSPDALTFAFKALSKDTSLEKADIGIESVPARVFCPICNKDFTLDEPIFICQKCGNIDLKLVSGRELLLESMEVE